MTLWQWLKQFFKNDIGEYLQLVRVHEVHVKKVIPNIRYLIPLCIEFKSKHGGTALIESVVFIEGEVPTDQPTEKEHQEL